MTRQISLSVNDVPIQLDYFIQGYVDHVIGGIVASLKDTGEIESLQLSIDNEGQVTINLNGSVVPISYFPNKIIRSTILGMVSTLKGVGEVDRLEMTIDRS
jgi:sulfur carrier protein ThiS